MYTLLLEGASARIKDVAPLFQNKKPFKRLLVYKQRNLKNTTNLQNKSRTVFLVFERSSIESFAGNYSHLTLSPVCFQKLWINNKDFIRFQKCDGLWKDMYGLWDKIVVCTAVIQLGDYKYLTKRQNKRSELP